MEFAQAANLVLTLASAALFLRVGRVIQKRVVSPDAQMANNGFVVWWYGLGITTLAGASFALPGFPRDLDLFIAITAVLLFVLCAALWGLLVYLIFLFTDSNRLAWPLGIAYVGFFGFIVLYILKGKPFIQETSLGPTLKATIDLQGTPLFWALVLLLLLPQLLSALAYLTLYWKVDDPVQKRRILLVSLSILVWFGTSLAATGLQAANLAWWPTVSKLVSLGAAATIYYAYRGLKPRAPAPAAAAPAPAGEAEAGGKEAPPRRDVAPVG